MKTLRPYQNEFVAATLDALFENDRVLGVAATGAGKTVMASEIMRRCSDARCLFLADARQLVSQCADKYLSWTGENAGVEMGTEKALPGDRVVVATTQSMACRLDKWPRDYFRLIFVDEAHRNTLGAQAQKVLGHFSSAQVVGITATPFRADKRQLSTFYQSIADVDCGLMRLINEGWLSRITIRSVPCSIDLKNVRTKAGDYRDDDLDEVITPHLDRLAQLLAEHAKGRRTVAFLPLIETSKAFAEACRRHGLHAVHVDGKDRDALRSDWEVICNSALLTTGWDEPTVSCVYICRPTKSLTLYSQMVGRGTRISPGKSDCLLLDPLFLSDKLDLIKPARLIAKDDTEAKAMQTILDGVGGDLLEVRERAEADRQASMVKALKEKAQRKARSVDAITFAVSMDDYSLAEYEPEAAWEMAEISDKQREILDKNGIDLDSVTCKGHASKILDLIFKRRELGLASPKQVMWLVKLGHHNPNLATFDEASAFLDAKFSKGKKTA